MVPKHTMDATQFRGAAKQLIDYIADYIEGLRTRPVLPNVQPGYINRLVPEEAPPQGEPWTDLFNDIEDVVMKGVSQIINYYKIKNSHYLRNSNFLFDISFGLLLYF